MPDGRKFDTAIRGLGLVALVAIVLAMGVTLTLAPSDQRTVRVEFVKYLMQFIVVLIVSGIVAEVFKGIERSSQAAQARSTLRKAFAQQLGTAYRSVKESRRVLRVAGLSRAYGPPPDEITDAQRAIYDQQIKRISAAQYTLEALQVEGRYVFAPEEWPAIHETLQTMEEYLSGLVSEHEEKGAQRPLTFAALPLLDDLTSKGGGRQFVDSLWRAHRSAVKRIYEGRTTPRPGRGTS